MNCPNCGGLLDIDNKRCEYCNTEFTYEELHPLEQVHKENGKGVEKEDSNASEKTLTQKRQEEIAKEKANRTNTDSGQDTAYIATGAALMGIFGAFSGIRRFFRELKRILCLVLLIALEAGFFFLIISGKLSSIFDDDIASFAAVNAVLLINASAIGLVCRIGRMRIATPLTAVITLFAVIWVFAYPLVSTGFENVSASYAVVVAVVEMVVLTFCVLLSHLVYGR